MAIVLSGTTGIDAGSLPVNNCGNTEVEGNLNLSSVGTRITGDFSNATASNRVAFQTSVTNGNTIVSARPNGNGTQGMFMCESSQDADNCQTMNIQATSTDTKVVSAIRGTAAYVPMAFLTGGSERVRIDTAGNVGIGTVDVYGKLGIAGQVGINCGSAQALSARGLQFFIDGTKHGNLSVDNYDNLLYIGNGIGYGTGAGGTVTQLTSKGTDVTLNKPTGLIFMNNAALAAGASVEFYLNNSLLSSSDTLVVSGGIYSYNYTTQVKTVSSNIATIRVTNVTGGTLSEPLAISFTVLKGATS